MKLIRKENRNFNRQRYKTKTYNLKKKKRNKGNEKGNKKLINLKCNYISLAQIYESKKF